MYIVVAAADIASPPSASWWLRPEAAAALGISAFGHRCSRSCQDGDYVDVFLGTFDSRAELHGRRHGAARTCIFSLCCQKCGEVAQSGTALRALCAFRRSDVL